MKSTANAMTDKRKSKLLKEAKALIASRDGKGRTCAKLERAISAKRHAQIETILNNVASQVKPLKGKSTKTKKKVGVSKPIAVAPSPKILKANSVEKRSEIIGGRVNKVIELDKTQLEIIEAPGDSRMIVIAAPGTGKTEVAGSSHGLSGQRAWHVPVQTSGSELHADRGGRAQEAHSGHPWRVKWSPCTLRVYRDHGQPSVADAVRARGCRADICRWFRGLHREHGGAGEGGG